jgi:hypothetical protein
MFSRTAAALAAALIIGMTSPSIAAEGPDVTDRWNHDRGGAPYWTGWRELGYVYGAPAYGYGPGYVYGSPGIVYGGPRVVIEPDVNIGYVPRRYYGYDWD